MICIFFIDGSGFKQTIKPNPKWVQALKDKNYHIQCAKIANLASLRKSFVAFQKECHRTFEHAQVGVFGISSGGYFAQRLHALYGCDFCITLCPIFNPAYRKNFLLSKKNHLQKTRRLPKNARTTRKIGNKIDDHSLVIVGNKDMYAPLSMYEPYDIKHFMVLKNKDHRITTYPHGKIMKKMEEFILS